jgi:hypothetical protein
MPYLYWDGKRNRHALGMPGAYIMEDGDWQSDKVLKSVYRYAMDD